MDTVLCGGDTALVMTCPVKAGEFATKVDTELTGSGHYALVVHQIPSSKEYGLYDRAILIGHRLRTYLNLTKGLSDGVLSQLN